MRLVNAEEVLQAWRSFLDSYSATLILIRHAAKIEGAGSRCGLSDRGREQVSLYRQTDPLPWNRIAQLCTCYSSITRRNVETLELLFPSSPIICSTGLDLPDLGPNDEDYLAARELGKRLSVTPNEAFQRLEEHGIARVGEPPQKSRPRIRKALFDLLTASANPEREKNIIYSCNSPTANEALGVEGAIPELSTLFFTFDGDFLLQTRIDPVFAD